MKDCTVTQKKKARQQSRLFAGRESRMTHFIALLFRYQCLHNLLSSGARRLSVTLAFNCPNTASTQWSLVSLTIDSTEKSQCRTPFLQLLLTPIPCTSTSLRTLKTARPLPPSTRSIQRD